MNLDAHLLLVDSIGILHVIGLDLTVFQLDTLGNGLQVVSGDVLVEIDVIDLLLEIFRMGELRCEVTIVGEQKHTRGVTVEASHWIDALRAGILDEVHHRLALLGIVTSGDIVLGLVEQHIDLLLQCNGLVVELHLVGAQDLRAELGNHLSVDGDHTSLDELIGLATAADTGISQILVQTNGLVGIVIDLLILDALLQAILCIGIVVSGMGTLAIRFLGTIRGIAIATLAIRTVAGTASLLTGLIATAAVAVVAIATA